jgi:SAM-dependent methyltransferase
MKLPEGDRRNAVDRYTERYQEHGYSPLTLGWNKGRQPIRFDVLTSQYDFSGKAVLDIGCGFGDLLHTLGDKFEPVAAYTGVDLVEPLVEEARQRWPAHSFLTGDFLEIEFDHHFDFAVASGVFNHLLDGIDNEAFIEASMQRAFAVCRDGFAFDFLSDKVDYRLDHTYHASPERVLSMAYSLSRNVVLRNDYFPFEFSVFVFNDDGFDPDTAVFDRYLRISAQGPS